MREAAAGVDVFATVVVIASFGGDETSGDEV
jgi:hypothetical protein